MKKDTICALSTPSGKGALAVIRISGPEASKKMRSFVHLPKTLESHKAYVRIFKVGKISLDQVVLIYFKEGHSFTGEETFEISCHGGPFIYSRILQALLKKGFRLAEPGEFSLRAFYNGKKDLVQAEALFQLIESRNERARQNAFFQMEGRLSSKLEELEKKWLNLLSHLEADIDFSMEGINVLSSRARQEALKDLLQEVQNLIDRYQSFENLQRGLVVGFFGPVNSGKSTLFNRILGEKKAIVTEEEGTTRDIVEGQIRRGTLDISLKDTAGARKTLNLAEKMGQSKTQELFFSCQVPIIVLEAPGVLSQESSCSLKSLFLWLEKGKKREKIKSQKKRKVEGIHKKTSLCESAESRFLKRGLVVVTKKDLCPGSEKKDLLKNLNLSPSFLSRVFYFSNQKETRSGEFLKFKEKLLSFSSTQKEKEGFLITSLRQLQGFQKMKEALIESLELEKGLGERDLMALALRRGLLSLYEITGKQLDDKVLDTVFKKFCIGK